MKISIRNKHLPLLGLALLGVSAVALAGSPHFVSLTATQGGNSLTVSGKEAGLGNETQVSILVSADAACVNPGSKRPKADNKQSFSAAGDFPVQNGKADFLLTLTASMQPNCSPPMTIVWSNIEVCDLSHDLCRKF